MEKFGFKKIISGLSSVEERQIDDAIYARIHEEYSNDVLDPVSQARAIESANGDEAKLKSEYVKHRFRRLKDEYNTLASETTKQPQAPEVEPVVQTSGPVKVKIGPIGWFLALALTGIILGWLA